MTQDWSAITLEALQRLWEGFINFIPKLVVALIVFIIGWFIAGWIGKLVSEILKRLKVDRIFERAKWQEALEKAEFKVEVSEFIGAIIKWVLVIAFLLAAVKILGLTQFDVFLTGDKGVVTWLLPNLVVAAAIFVVAVIVADFAEKVVKASLKRMEVSYAEVGATIVKWAILLFAGLMILNQFEIATEIIQILVSGFVALIVISCGIAFGLGGKDIAREILENLRRKLR